MTYWLAQTYLKIFNGKFTVKGECGNGTLQATVSGDVIIWEDMWGGILDRSGAVKIDMALGNNGRLS